MSRRLLLAASGNAPAPVTPGDPDDPDTPGTPGVTPIPSYVIPLVPPFNVGTLATTPTDDGTGEAMHPDVVDFGATPWNGYRYWLAVTAFADAANENENPHVLCSNSGWEFTEPAPGVNPLDPWPGAATSNTQWYNSDTDIHYDPDADELVVTWREVVASTGSETIWLTASTDGVTWSAPASIWTTSGGIVNNVSQSLIKVSPTEWRLYFYQIQQFWTATSRLGPYTSPQTFTLTGFPSGYHGDVIKHGDRYYALFQQSGVEYPATSTDGITFTVGAAILQSGTFYGLTQTMYRSTMQIDPLNPSVVGVWYGAHENNSSPPDNKFNTAYTRVPLSKWPA